MAKKPTKKLDEIGKKFGADREKALNLSLIHIQMCIRDRYQDERLTTVAAERMLIEQADISRNKRKKVIDKLAAQLILQNYLDRKF